MSKTVRISDELYNKITSNGKDEVNFSDAMENYLKNNTSNSLFGVLEFKDKSLEQKMKEEIKLIKSNPDMWDYLNAEIASYTSNLIYEAYTTLNLRGKPKIPDKDGDIQVAFEELSEEQKAEYMKLDPTCKRTSILNLKVK